VRATLITLYRAGAPGLHEVEGLTSWTTSKEHALDYAGGRFHHFGGPCLYRAEAEAGTVFDARPGLGRALRDLGLDLGDYPHEPPHDLLRNLAPVLRSDGYAWAAFSDLDTPPGWDEWIYLGTRPVPVTPAR
jgi:hypothetical protein